MFCEQRPESLPEEDVNEEIGGRVDDDEEVTYVAGIEEWVRTFRFIRVYVFDNVNDTIWSVTQYKLEDNDDDDCGDVSLDRTETGDRTPSLVDARTSQLTEKEHVENDRRDQRDDQDHCRVEYVQVIEFERCVAAQLGRHSLGIRDVGGVVISRPDDVVLQESRDVENDGAEDDDGNLYSSRFQGQPSPGGERITDGDETVDGQEDCDPYRAGLGYVSERVYVLFQVRYGVSKFWLG